MKDPTSIRRTTRRLWSLSLSAGLQVSKSFSRARHVEQLFTAYGMMSRVLEVGYNNVVCTVCSLNTIEAFTLTT
ncbi:hypothetical protein PROFUN_11080 [Planoprotostelium fungivorum]|uniref:Uncharacterized protein n=1 Tax=Planoprotostelium fungivorum TaxID=1890364 RepID=A0A2P6NAI6_9EUKA|nr:hypothetical protein PROFUN_11080 [Planoprotostelium fungivorum]